MTYFETVTRSYTDVDTSKGINTEQFLEATEGVVKLFGNSAPHSEMKGGAVISPFTT